MLLDDIPRVDAKVLHDGAEDDGGACEDEGDEDHQDGDCLRERVSVSAASRATVRESRVLTLLTDMAGRDEAGVDEGTALRWGRVGRVTSCAGGEAGPSRGM